MKLISGLGNGQVLQRNSTRSGAVKLVGTASGNGPIRATLSRGSRVLNGWKNHVVGKVSRGKFRLRLSSLPVGGPYKLKLEAGGGQVVISPFFVGDVWLLAGQSNMEGVGHMRHAAKTHPLIRAFSMRREWRLAEDPLHILPESPDACHARVQYSPEAAEQLRRKAVKGVGVGLFFARDMLERSGGVPQGLICTSHGGTSMQQWSPDLKNQGGESLYGSMLASVRATGQGLAGLLWYQGESDANPTDAPLYTQRMRKLVAATRRDLGQPNLPWFIVQIARVNTEPSSPVPWNSIQEQQRLLPGKIKKLETVPAIDLPLDDGIHIGSQGFPRLAARLASAADRVVHGNKRETRTPQLKSVRVAAPYPEFAMEVAFDFVQGRLQSEGEPAGFRFISAEGTPLDLIYKTELDGNIARLHMTKKPEDGTTLFYGHGFVPYCNITDARGFSPPVFGPVALPRSKPKALLPFITKWNVTEIIPAVPKLDRISLSVVKALRADEKSYPDEGFINQHETWQFHSGLAFFQSRLRLPQPMKLEFLMGYDGPFRLWLDGKSVFKNMAGINPCFKDESTRSVTLGAGEHDVHVGMDLNDARAWGFYLRMARTDVTKGQLASGEFVKPTYLL